MSFINRCLGNPVETKKAVVFNGILSSVVGLQALFLTSLPQDALFAKILKGIPQTQD